MTRQTHGRTLIAVSINLCLYSPTPLNLDVSDEVDNANPALAESKEKVESTFDERESVLGQYHFLVRSTGADV
jgi:hypothetical protein